MNAAQAVWIVLQVLIFGGMAGYCTVSGDFVAGGIWAVAFAIADRPR